jgi:hypothetical protein
MSNVNLSTEVTLNQFASAVQTVGREVTIIGQGEPGIGKSSVLKTLAQAMPDYETAYIDCTLLDLGDFALPYTEQHGDMKVTKFAPNARFKLHQKKPVIVMLDEIGKAMKPVKNVLLTLMLEQRIGDCKLPEGSIVFGTTNLVTDGVGDILEAHARNRVCLTKVAKPDSDQWIEWAMGANIAVEVIAWVKQFPHALASYTDGSSAKDNPYIYSPTRAGSSAFVTPRSLEKASDIVKQRHILGDDLTINLLSGTIGESAARDMQGFLQVADKLPSWEAMTKDPQNCRIPDDAVAKCILIFSAVTRMDRTSLPSIMQYIRRMELEWQALFASTAMKATRTQGVCCSDKSFVNWCADNAWAL